MPEMSERRRGTLYAIAAYGMWGLFPLYWPLLKPAGALEILAHRIVWSLATVVVILAARHQWAWIPALLRNPRKVGLLTLAAALVSVNWGVYIYAVNSAQVVESALGYFINPLVSVLLGVFVFRERLRPWQWVATAFAAVAVVVLTVNHGRPPWIALVLAGSFATYGLVKKTAQVGALESLTIETVALFLPALIYLGRLHQRGDDSFVGHGGAHVLLLIGSGVITALPLLCFTAAALRIPLTAIGLLQYIAPTLQFLCGVLVTHETMPPARWAGFSLVWVALAIFAWDGLRTASFWPGRSSSLREEQP
ncbi:MAG: chloramphenicol-sensitive protein RarD [Myxococcales bacterium]|jgi:chloramphenicol-sensitive protein RarD|nr:chloramphenicol-sensitive protein RarD [Myxococcales bacterium]